MEDSKQIRVAINGMGRIGRSFLKAYFKNQEFHPRLSIVAVNDLGDVENLAYLLKYDSAYGRSGLDVKVEGLNLVINGEKIAVLQKKDPAELPWKEHNIDVVVESTGLFESYEKASVHVKAGARRVVISAPAKDGVGEGKTVLMGINDWQLKKCTVSSNASCTTNAASPVIQALHETIGVEKAVLNTAHGYTATQKLVDGPDARDWRRGRAAAHNIVPATTGAAIAVTLAIPDLQGKFDGIALRVPVIAGSVADITFISKRDTTPEEVNQILRRAAAEDRWKGVLTVIDEQVVSSDIVGMPEASIVDASFTRVVGGNLVKVLAWYDNEWGYANVLLKHVAEAGRHDTE